MKNSTHVSWLALVGALAVAPLGASFAADSTTTADPTLTRPAATDTTTTAAPEKPKGADVPVVDVDTSTAPKSKGSLAQMVPGQMTVSDLIGESVVNASGDTIGEINDLVLDQDHIPYVVLSVGGFLGVGTDYVAVPFDKLQINHTGDGDAQVQIVANVTEDDLKKLAAAQRGEETTSEAGRSVPPADTTGDMTTAPAADTTAAAPADTTTTAPADTTAAAPADTAADTTAPAATTTPADGTTSGTAAAAPATTDTTGARTQIAAAYANLTADDLIGKTVVNTAGDNIGEIEDLVIDGQKVVMAVVSVGGFLGIGEKYVAVPLEQLTLSADKATLASGLTKDDLAKMPAYEKGKLHGIERGQPIFGNS